MESYRRAIIIGKPFFPIMEITLERVLEHLGKNGFANVWYKYGSDSMPLYVFGNRALDTESLAGMTYKISNSAAERLTQAKELLDELGPDDVLVSVESALFHGRFKTAFSDETGFSPDVDGYDLITSMKGEPCIIIEAYALMLPDETEARLLIRNYSSAIREDLTREIAERILSKTKDIRELVDTDPSQASEEEIMDSIQAFYLFISGSGLRPRVHPDDPFEATVYGVFDIIRASIGVTQTFAEICFKLVASIPETLLPKPEEE